GAVRRASAYGLLQLPQRTRARIRPHCRQEQPLRLSGSWLHKTLDVEPLAAMLDGHTRPGPFTHPDPAQDRAQPNAMLISRPQLDRGLGKRLLHRVQLIREFFLHACCPVGSALAWCGCMTRLILFS